MTPDEIIEMARQAGIPGWADHEPLTADHLLCFARLVAAKYEQKIQELEDMITELQERQA